MDEASASENLAVLDDAQEVPNRLGKGAVLEPGSRRHELVERAAIAQRKRGQDCCGFGLIRGIARILRAVDEHCARLVKVGRMEPRRQPRWPAEERYRAEVAELAE